MSSFVLALGIAALGGLGAVTRFTIDTQIKRAYKAAFPLTTLLINAIASFLAGMFAAMAAYGAMGADAKLLLATGFCGGLSTFSTAINEITSLLKSDRLGTAAAYMATCVVVPLLCVIAGYAVI